jgi:signal transduction histidine kinase
MQMVATIAQLTEPAGRPATGVSPLPDGPRHGAERVIATGRVVLAAMSLVVLSLDPTTPAVDPGATFLLLGSFLVYGCGMLLASTLWPALLVRTRMAAHILDLGVFGALMYLTEGPNSPFFLFFSLSLVAAAVRWQWRGVLWTAVTVLIVYDGSILYAAMVLGSPGFEPDRFFVRTIYLAVLAGALGYLGWYESRLRSEMLVLASWSPVPGRRRRTSIALMLERTARTFGAGSAFLFWEDPVEPWSRLDSWAGGRFESRSLAPGEASLVAEPFTSSDFITGSHGRRVENWIREPNGIRRSHGAILSAVMRELSGSDEVLSLQVRGAHARGRLFVAGSQPFTPDDFIAGRIVAHRAASTMDYLHLVRRLRVAAARNERLRLSRDLHDGLLQSLTGAALQLETADALWDRAPAAARQRLREIQRFIADEQRELRIFIESLRPGRPAHGRYSLTKGLVDLGERFRTVWNLDVRWEIRFADADVPARLRRHVYSLIQEGLANSARHGKANAALVRVECTDTGLDLVIADNGRGFSFSGRYEHHELESRDAGPVSLRNRLFSLGGTLAIESGPGGARLEIGLPTNQSAANADPHRSR